MSPIKTRSASPSTSGQVYRRMPSFRTGGSVSLVTDLILGDPLGCAFKWLEPCVYLAYSFDLHKLNPWRVG